MKGFYEMIQSLLENEIGLEKRKTKFDEFNVSPNECLYIIDFNQNKLTLKKGFPGVLGYKDEEMDLDLLVKGYHPEDEEVVTKVIREAVLHTLKYPENGDGNTLSLKYRRQKKDGSYITVLSQSHIFDIEKSGKSMKSITKLTDISFLNDFTSAAYNFEASYLDKDDFDKEIHSTYSDLFTKRELEVIKELSNELTNREIGEKLFISQHTVATHRKNILRKSNCHSTLELLEFCHAKGVLK